ncbi:PIN-like domain-containing protein [Crenothrix polyspora]|uniref:PIN like domain-containing protein n=1 Tax=Crenothrix polyspora TaxID=360316 RepID=A0A1R4HEF6_9GAMM|nr:PIN domain-containing protein [Crenothrix polyspora]SJM94625.1 hypothetical protein CRENPOLYSF1_560001 [Crenothrix polyspora]
MKSVFIGHFRPTQDEFTQLWDESIFAIDANVLLNLYRYSSDTREELEKALNEIKDKVFITHQAAKEFLKNRLNVTAGQADEYKKTISSINNVLATLSSSDRHPFLPDSELPKLKEYAGNLIFILEKQQKLLLAKLTDDEILDFVEKLFDGKTGRPFSNEKLIEIAKEGEERYQRETPPGYKDNKKDSLNDPYRKYGDLIVWHQILEHAATHAKSVIFITDDKKDDWWLEQSGKTIAPRPELIEEFHEKTKQKFWMYTVDRFIQESAKISKSTVSSEVIEEIIKVSMDINESNLRELPSIEVYQDPFDSPVDEWQGGFLIVHLNRPMRYATGTGKFHPKFSTIPEFNVKLVDSPYEDKNMVTLSFGCGTTRDFNVHLRARDTFLEAGNYIFEYTASESIEVEEK